MAPLLALVLIELAPIKVTGTAFVIVNEFAVMLFARLTVDAGTEEIRRAPRGVVPPKAPERVIAPEVPAFNVKFCVPLIVPPKEIAPLLALVSIMLAPVKVAGTGFVIVKELAVMLFARLTVEHFTEEIRRAPRGVDPPKMPERVMAPEVPAFNVKF